jgi:hypothetical protein
MLDQHDTGCPKNPKNRKVSITLSGKEYNLTELLKKQYKELNIFKKIQCSLWSLYWKIKYKWLR